MVPQKNLITVQRLKRGWGIYTCCGSNALAEEGSRRSKGRREECGKSRRSWEGAERGRMNRREGGGTEKKWGKKRFSNPSPEWQPHSGQEPVLSPYHLSQPAAPPQNPVVCPWCGEEGGGRQAILISGGVFVKEGERGAVLLRSLSTCSDLEEVCSPAGLWVPAVLL